jgi:hypothetical protein
MAKDSSKLDSIFEQVEAQMTEPKVSVEGVIGFLLTSVAGVLIRGALMEWGWNHFAVHGLNVPPINAAIALGIASLAFFATNDPTMLLAQADDLLKRKGLNALIYKQFSFYLITFVSWLVIWQFV